MQQPLLLEENQSSTSWGVRGRRMKLLSLPARAEGWPSCCSTQRRICSGVMPGTCTHSIGDSCTKIQHHWQQRLLNDAHSSAPEFGACG